jgi:hypothetical protein
MARGACNFRETDLKRAIKAVRAAGMEIARVEIRKDVIVMVPSKPEKPDERSETNEWDSVA